MIELSFYGLTAMLCGQRKGTAPKVNLFCHLMQYNWYNVSEKLTGLRQPGVAGIDMPPAGASGTIGSAGFAANR